MAQALYRKWRPQTFEEVVGQEHVVRTLRNALTAENVHHAYLLSGPRGTGKTSTARLLAKAVNCLAPEPANRPCNACAICQAVNERRLIDLIEIDAASNTGVDDVRELRERVGYRPNEARYKVYVIDEVHMLSNAAFNALLKTLEEPPPHAIFVLATTEPQKIPATVLSRCQRFDFRRIPLADIVARLQHLSEQEKITADVEVLTLIARQATGSMRDAESLLDQLSAYDKEGITVEAVQAALGTGAEASVLALTEALASGDVSQGLTLINQAADQGTDPRQFARQIVQHLRGLMLTGLGSDVTLHHVSDEQQETFQAQAARFNPRQLARAVRLFNQAATEARTAWQPQLALELALIEAMLPAEPSPTPSGGKTPGSKNPSPNHPKPAPPKTHPAAAAAKKPQATPPSRSAESTETLPSLEEVQDRWTEFLGSIRPYNLSLEALLRSANPVKVEEGAVVIGFEHQFHKSKVEEKDNLQVIENAWGELLGQTVQVRCVMARGHTPSQSAKPAPTSTSQSPPEAEDKLVQAAVEKLGARVVDNAP